LPLGEFCGPIKVASLRYQVVSFQVVSCCIQPRNALPCFLLRYTLLPLITPVIHKCHAKAPFDDALLPNLRLGVGSQVMSLQQSPSQNAGRFSISPCTIVTLSDSISRACRFAGRSCRLNFARRNSRLTHSNPRWHTVSRLLLKPILLGFMPFPSDINMRISRRRQLDPRGGFQFPT
jgi:hypothetical protein